MVVANGAVVGVPAIHRLQNLPARHTESARRAGMEALAGGVTVRLACSDEARPQPIYRMPARRGEPVDTGCAEASSVAEIPAQNSGVEMVGMRESVQVGLHGFGRNGATVRGKGAAGPRGQVAIVRASTCISLS